MSIQRKKQTSKEKNKNQDSLDKELLTIEKEYGKGIVMNLEENFKINIETIPTGSFNLDEALGIGGIPYGKTVELFGQEASGKTTLALTIIRELQKKGQKAVYVDAECALDKNYAKKIGIDTKQLLVIRPEWGEQALDIVEKLTASKKVSLIIVDSVASLVSKAELEASHNDANIGLQARLMSKAMRKLTGLLSKTNTTIIFINQIREKVGVMFGCVHGQTKVLTEKGGIPIKRIVDNKLKLKVYSYNDNKNVFELKPIMDYHLNGKVNNNKDYLYIESEGIETKNGKIGITVTPDHFILTNFGYKKAKDLEIGDVLITKYEEIINNNLLDFISGMLIGDSHINIRKTNTASIRFQNVGNKNYTKWKIDKLNNFFKLRKINNLFYTPYRFEIKLLKDWINHNRNPIPILLENWSFLTFAIWIMDDGHLDLSKNHCRYILSIKRFKNDRIILEEIKRVFKSRGLNCSYNSKSGAFYFSKNSTLKIANNIKNYVPYCMQYKLPKEYRNKYIDFVLNNEKLIRTAHSKIISIRTSSNKQMRNKNKYDLTIKDNFNYLIGNSDNGVVVHNSPEITPGGRALKFYASIRIELRRGSPIKHNDQVIGTLVRAKVVKNKLAIPFQKAEFKIYGDEGISHTAEILDLAIKHGVITKNGSWFSFNDEQLAQGYYNTRLFLKNNLEVFNKIKEQVLKLLDKKEEAMYPPEVGNSESKGEVLNETEKPKKKRGRPKK